MTKSESREKPCLCGQHSSSLSTYPGQSSLPCLTLSYHNIIYILYVQSRVIHNILYKKHSHGSIPSAVLYSEDNTLSHSLWANITCWLNVFTWIKWYCVHSQILYNIMFQFSSIICIMTLVDNVGHSTEAPNPSNLDTCTSHVFCSVLTD